MGQKTPGESDYLKVGNKVFRFYARVFSKPEKVQLYRVARFKAEKTYNKEKGTKELTWFYNILKWECLTYWNMFYEREEILIDKFDYLTKEPESHQNIQKASVYIRESEILTDKFVNRLTYQEMSEKYKCSHRKVYTKIKKAMKGLAEWCI